MARNFEICTLASLLLELLPLTQRNQLVLLYIVDCKDEGNTLKPYLPEKKTVAVFKTLVL